MEYKIFNGQIMDLMKMLSSGSKVSYSKGFLSYNFFIKSDTVMTLKLYKRMLRKFKANYDDLSSTKVLLLKITVDNTVYIMKDSRHEEIILSYYGTKNNSSLIMDKDPEEDIVVSSHTGHNFRGYKDVMSLKNLFEYDKKEKYVRIKATPIKKHLGLVVNNFHRYDDILRDYLGLPSENFDYKSMNIKLKEQEEPSFNQPRLTRQMSLLGEMVYYSFEKQDRDESKNLSKKYSFKGDKSRIIIDKTPPGDFKVLGHQKDVQDFIDSGDFHDMYDERFLICLNVFYLENGLVLLVLRSQTLNSLSDIRNEYRQEYYQNKGMIIYKNKISKIVDMGDISCYKYSNILTDKEKISHTEFRKLLEKI
ncbi:hypothetical protein LMHOCYYV_CDS0059 [Staphylococcus phage PG-2021_4]